MMMSILPIQLNPVCAAVRLRGRRVLPRTLPLFRDLEPIKTWYQNPKAGKSERHMSKSPLWRIFTQSWSERGPRTPQRKYPAINLDDPLPKVENSLVRSLEFRIQFHLDLDVSSLHSCFLWAGCGSHTYFSPPLECIMCGFGVGLLGSEVFRPQRGLVKLSVTASPKKHIWCRKYQIHAASSRV